jgi:hypothetical protein
MLSRSDPNELTTFYEQLSHTYETYNRTSYFTIIAGDLNSKLGLKADPTETFMGKHGKGTRNLNGHNLANFMQEHNLYATNTTFDHPMRHRTTWQGPNRDKTIYNQIDYILIARRQLFRHKCLLQSSRSFGGTIFGSDNKLVITSFNLKRFSYICRPKLLNDRPFDTSTMATDKEVQKRFQNDIATYFFCNPNVNPDPNESYKTVTAAITKIAAAHAPIQYQSLRGKIKFTNDPQLTAWSWQRSRFRHQFYHPSCSQSDRKRLARLKNTLDALIKRRIKQLYEERLIRIADTLEQNRGNKKCYEALRLLRKYADTQFHLVDDQQHKITNPEQAIPLLNSWYKNFFNQEGIEPIEPWSGPPRPLDVPITAEEVSKAAMSLSNGRATGKDAIPCEFLKYGGQALHEYLAQILNTVFESHAHFHSLGEGLLVPLNKSNGKPATASNTRPITLLNSIRNTVKHLIAAHLPPSRRLHIH